jgi:hypothetical protein
VRWIAILALLLMPVSAAAEGSSAGHGRGGWFADFDPIVRQYNASGERFRIRGHCQSACTLFLGIRNVCVERDARLLFHAGHDRQRNIAEKPTQRLLAAYKPSLRYDIGCRHDWPVRL